MSDFNNLNVDDIQESCHLRQLVDFNTRSDAQLDLIFTNSADYEKSEQLALLERNDHCAIFLSSRLAKEEEHVHKVKRSINPTVKNNIMLDIIQLNWRHVLEAEDVDTKVILLHEKVNKVLDIYAPLRSVKMRKKAI